MLESLFSLLHRVQADSSLALSASSIITVTVSSCFLSLSLSLPFFLSVDLVRPCSSATQYTLRAVDKPEILSPLRNGVEDVPVLVDPIDDRLAHLLRLFLSTPSLLCGCSFGCILGPHTFGNFLVAGQFMGRLLNSFLMSGFCNFPGMGIAIRPREPNAP